MWQSAKKHVMTLLFKHDMLHGPSHATHHLNNIQLRKSVTIVLISRCKEWKEPLLTHGLTPSNGNGCQTFCSDSCTMLFSILWLGQGEENWQRYSFPLESLKNYPLALMKPEIYIFFHFTLSPHKNAYPYIAEFLP